MPKKPSYKLDYPYKYYWSRYAEECVCPFCKSDQIYTSDNYDIIFCEAYGGYLSIYADSSYAGDKGDCKNCIPSDPLMDGKSWSVEKCEETSPCRHVVKDPMFLCEECHHGVIFTKPPKMVKELFLHPKEDCKHCNWHNKHIK